MKTRPSKPDQFTDQIEEWFGAEKITIAAARDRLAGLGCAVSSGRLSQWWGARQQSRLEEQLLDRVASGAQLSREIEAKFARNAPPEIATIVQILRTLVLQLSVKGQADHTLLGLVSDLLKRVMDWERVKQAQAALQLERERFRRETCELYLSWSEDQRAKDITASSASNADKIASLYGLMFAEEQK